MNRFAAAASGITKKSRSTNPIAASRRIYESGAGDYAPVLDAEIARLTLLSELSAAKAEAIAHAAHFDRELEKK